MQDLLLCTHIEGRDEQEPVVFLPGFVGSYTAWNSDFRVLGKSYRLIFLDTLGFGCSPKPDIEYSFADHLAAIRATLHLSLSIEKAHFVGHSMGSLLALAYACQFPEAVKTATLLALTVYSSEQEARQIVGRTSLFTRLAALDTPLAHAACEVMCSIRPLLMVVAPLFAPDVPPAVARAGLQHTWHSYSRTLRNVILKSRAREWLPQVKQPLLITQGAHDRIAPLEVVKQAVSGLPNVQLHVLEAGHRFVFTHSAVVSTELARFLAENNGSGSRPG